MSLVILLTHRQTEPMRPFATGFGMKPTFHQFHAKLSQEGLVIKSFWSLEPECLKARKQVLVSNGVRRSYPTLLLEKSCHRTRETSVFIGPHRSLPLGPRAHDPTPCRVDRERDVPG